MAMPEGYVRDSNELRPMTLEERIIAGLDNPSPGQKVEGGKVVPMTMDELHNVGLISNDDWQKIKLSEAEAELNSRLSELNTEEAKTMAELDGAYAAERKAKLLALLAVKKQAGWPLEVKWP